MFANPPLVVFLVVFIILGSFGINGLLVALINESILDPLDMRAPDKESICVCFSLSLSLALVS